MEQENLARIVASSALILALTGLTFLTSRRWVYYEYNARKR